MAKKGKLQSISMCGDLATENAEPAAACCQRHAWRA